MPRTGLTIDRVALAGAQIADELGADQVTVARVARRLDVQPPSLYGHVAGSSELHAQVTRLALEELADAATTALAGRSGRAALLAYAEVLRTYAADHPGRYAASRRPGTATEAELTAGRRHADLWAAVLHGYGLAPERIVHATRLLASTFHGFISLQASGSFDHSLPPAHESWDHVLDAVDGVLRSWSTL